MSQRGSASVVAAALVAGLVIVATGFALAGRVVAAHAQATVAADAAALAAAPLTFLGGDPSEEASAYAEANGARVVTCACRLDRRPVPRTVAVVVELPVELPFAGRVTIRARAAAEFDPAVLWGGSGPVTPTP